MIRGFMLVVAAILTTGLAFGGTGETHDRSLQITLDRSEADAALAIIETVNAGKEPSRAQQNALLGSRPYARLREREEQMKRPFTDAEFLAYLHSPEARQAAPLLRPVLARWRPEAIEAAADRARAYLPAGATMRATIFPMIKPRPNTFVFDVQDDPAIFYALDSAEPQAKFANTLAHELHHIGLGQNCPSEDRPAAPGVAALRGWIGAFGEGLAMLAAAGGPDRDPHADSKVEERALWNSEMAKVDGYFRQQDAFFRSVMNGTAGSKEQVDKAMFGYFGEAQGPWYSVGYRMAVTIKQELGRAAVIDAFCHSDSLLATYNRAAGLKARRTGERLPTWDPALAAALKGS